MRAWRYHQAVPDVQPGLRARAVRSHVEVAGGSYPDQQLVETATGSSCNGRLIVFRPAASATPVVHYL